MQSIDSRLQELGIELPIAPPAAGLYVGAVRAGNLVFLSGQGPLVGKSVKYVGCVGSDLTEEQGRDAARLTGLNALAALKAELGSLDRVKRIVKVLAWVRSAPGFQQQPSIVNGYSQLMLDVFGEKGVHARSALSAHELAFGMAFEAEMVVDIYPD